MRKVFLSLAVTGAVLGLSACNDTTNNSTTTAVNVEEVDVNTVEEIQTNTVETIADNATSNSDDRIGTRERGEPNEQ